MLHLPLTILPALLFGVTGALAANTNIQPTTNMAAAGGITHHILLPDTSTSISTTTRSTAQPSPTPDTNTNTNLAQTTNPNTGPGVFNSAIQHSRSHRRRCRRPPLTCDCSKNATELAALNALRAEHKCGNCTCVDGHRSGADGGSAGGRWVAGVVGAVVGLGGLMVLL